MVRATASAYSAGVVPYPHRALPQGWDVLSAFLVLSIIPPFLLLKHNYGETSGRRFLKGAIASLLVQQALVGLGLHLTTRTGKQHLLAQLTPADALTLARGSVASILVGLVRSGIRDRQGTAGRLSWGLLLLAETISDWLDGPIARRLEPTAWGSWLDLEADSWLTLASGMAAVGWGGLPSYAIVAPMVRYALPLRAVQQGTYGRANLGKTWWARVAGVAQMAVFTAALAPFGDARLQHTARSLLRVVAPLQVVCILLLARGLEKQRQERLTKTVMALRG